MKPISSNLIRAVLLAMLSVAGVTVFAAAYSSMHNGELMMGEAEREHYRGELHQQRTAQEESGGGGMSEGDDGTGGVGELRLYVVRHQRYASVGWSPSSWSATCGCGNPTHLLAQHR